MKRTVDSFDEGDTDSNGDMDLVFVSNHVKCVGKPIDEAENLTSTEYFAKRYAAFLDAVCITSDLLKAKFLVPVIETAAKKIFKKAVKRSYR